MKKSLLLIVFLVFIIPVLAQNVNVTFKLKLVGGLDTTRGVYIVGEISNWQFLKMTWEYDSVYTITVSLKSGDSLAYYYILNNTWDNYKQYREYPPEDGPCTPSEILKKNPDWKGDRAFVVPKNDTIIKDVWGSCETFVPVSVKNFENNPKVRIYPIPAFDVVNIEVDKEMQKLEIFDCTGNIILSQKVDNLQELSINTSNLPSGIYLLRIYYMNNQFINLKFLKF